MTSFESIPHLYHLITTSYQLVSPGKLALQYWHLQFFLRTLARNLCCWLFEETDTTALWTVWGCMVQHIIIWLPLTEQGNTFNHICPLLPWKCGALDAFLCVFWRGFNTQHSSRNEMVQCLTCFEWYHCVCLGISFEEAKDSTIVDCGCTLPHPYRSHDMWVYSGIPIFRTSW